MVQEVLCQKQVEEEEDYQQQEEQEVGYYHHHQEEAFCWSDKVLQGLLASISQSLTWAGLCEYITSWMKILHSKLRLCHHIAWCRASKRRDYLQRNNRLVAIEFEADLRTHLFTKWQCKASRNTSMVRGLETLCGRSLSYTRNISLSFWKATAAMTQ